MTKNDRPVGAFLSVTDLKDTIWGERALKAHAEGYLGPAASKKLLDDLLRAGD